MTRTLFIRFTRSLPILLWSMSYLAAIYSVVHISGSFWWFQKIALISSTSNLFGDRSATTCACGIFISTVLRSIGLGRCTGKSNVIFCNISAKGELSHTIHSLSLSTQSKLKLLYTLLVDVTKTCFKRSSNAAFNLLVFSKYSLLGGSCIARAKMIKLFRLHELLWNLTGICHTAYPFYWNLVCSPHSRVVESKWDLVDFVEQSTMIFPFSYKPWNTIESLDVDPRTRFKLHTNTLTLHDTLTVISCSIALSKRKRSIW